METTHFYLPARRLSECAEQTHSALCGGGGAQCYALAPHTTPAPKQSGKVLDFNAYRQAHPPEQPPAYLPEPVPQPTPPKSRVLWLGLLLDACATGAIIITLGVVLMQFLTL